MPKLGLGFKRLASKSANITPGIVTDNLVLKHKYDAGSVIPVSDGAAYFDGADDYIKLSSPITVTTNSATASICFWANRPETTGSWRAVLSAYDNAYSGESWVLFGSSFPSLYSESKTDSDVATAAIDIQANKWYHYTITYDTGTVKMYVDGVEQTVSGDNASNDLEIELIGDDSSFFKGYVCNVGIWNGTQLTQSQIKSIMNKNYAGLTDSEKTNLVSWWNLDVETNTSGESGTGGVKDHHGSNHGTLS